MKQQVKIKYDAKIVRFPPQSKTAKEWRDRWRQRLSQYEAIAREYMFIKGSGGTND